MAELPRIYSWDELVRGNPQQFRGTHYVRRNQYTDLIHEAEKQSRKASIYCQRSARQEIKIRELQEQLDFARENAKIWQEMFEKLEAQVYGLNDSQIETITNQKQN